MVLNCHDANPMCVLKQSLLCPKAAHFTVAASLRTVWYKACQFATEFIQLRTTKQFLSILFNLVSHFIFDNCLNV